MGVGGKGALIDAHNGWYQRSIEISPSIPVAIHDPLMPDSYNEIVPCADDEFSRLCKSIKNDFDKTVGK